MNKELFDKLSAVLLELKQASINIKNKDDYVKTINKYNMMFLGETFNVIFSEDMHGSLKDVFNIDIDTQTLNYYIPIVCDSLDMKYDTLIITEEMNNPQSKYFRIVLY